MQTILEPRSNKTAELPKGKPTRRRFLRAMLAAGTAAAGGALYATQIEPFWLDVHEVDVPIANLPAAFEGFRIAQLTDLHAGDQVPMEYLSRAVQRVNQLNPDCVAITGDLVTHAAQWIEPVAQLLGMLRSPVYVTFGNHDYDPRNAMPGAITILSRLLQQNLSAAGCVVLCNQSVAVHRGEQRLWLVGLEDLYTTRFMPARAFAGVPEIEAKICLSHNPDGTESLLPFKPDLILSGHTHGGQIRVPYYGAIKLPTSNKRLEQGRFQLPHGQLYVSRGVGFLARVRFACRPEIPVFRLHRA